MFVAVKFPVNVGVLDAKVRAEIENAPACGKHWLGKFRCKSMRQSEENNLRLSRNCFCIRIGKRHRGCFWQMREAGESFRQRFSRKLT